MRWYRAEIVGDGFMIDSGWQIPETKTIHFVFEAEDDEAARKRAEAFARSPETRREFWLTDYDPKISLMVFVGEVPPEECAYLA